MAGHNKWSKIKHKKAREDKKRGKVFTRLGREIQVAARDSGPDPQYNSALRQAMDRAMAENMPNDNIQRAIKRGAGLLPGQEIEEAIYEGYGPAGVAVIVCCLTDNRNRTVGEVRHAFAKAGGSLGENGSVMWMFERVGMISVQASDAGEESMLHAAIEAGANDVLLDDEEAGMWVFVCDVIGIHLVRQALLAAGFDVRDAVPGYFPKNTTELQATDVDSVMQLVDALENLDDVQEVYANFDVSDQELEQLAASM